MKLKRTSSLKRFNPDNVVDNPDPFEKKKELIDDGETEIEVNQFSDTGIFSKRIFGDLNSKSQYSCKCKEDPFTGEFYADGKFVCPKCGHPVEKVEANIDKEGWIDLKGNYLIKYTGYKFLEKMIGTNHIREIIMVPPTITLEGDIDTESLETIRTDVGVNGKYYHIGLWNLYDKYHEVLKYHYELNKKESDRDFDYLEKVFLNYEQRPEELSELERYLEVLYDKDNVFTDKIPVISLVLRPVMRTEDGLREDELNRTYGDILLSYKTLMMSVDQLQIIKDATILQLQAQYMQLSEQILDSIKGKSGLIRNQIMGKTFAHVKLS